MNYVQKYFDYPLGHKKSLKFLVEWKHEKNKQTKKQMNKQTGTKQNKTKQNKTKNTCF